MLLSASIQSASNRPRLLGLGDCLGDEFRIAAEPFGFLDELAALDLEDLYPATAFMIGGSDFERRQQAAEAEIVDLLEAALDLLAGRLLAAVCFEGVADRLDMDGGPQDAAIIDHRIVHLLWWLLALRLVHRLDFL